MLHNHDIINFLVTFTTFYRYRYLLLTSFNDNNIIFFFSDSVKKWLGSGSGFKAFLDPDPYGDFLLDPDPESMNMDPKHCWF